MSDLWPLDEDPFAEAWRGALHGLEARRGQKGEPAPERWDEWLKALFPNYCKSPFAKRHEEFWTHVYQTELHSSPVPFVSPWPRGGAKSTSAELGVANIGVRGKRRYALYVSETQDQADKHVATIASMLESEGIERCYPEHAQPAVGKFGNQKGWRRERLQTAGGFVVDALGLDTASRGIKVEDQRPDLIVLDDIDNKHDSPQTTARKIATITTSILPAGSSNVAVWVIQNLIIADGVVTRVVDGRADFLTQRIVSGPHPAIEDLKWEWQENLETGTRQATIIAGRATWEGQSLEKCQHLINTIGIGAFLKECQHLVKESKEGRALKNFDDAVHLEDISDEECRRIVSLGQPFAGIDFGDWRFAFVLRATDEHGVIHEIAEYFSQREELEHRARVIHAILTYYGCPSNTPIRGDAANPTDIREINAAFRRIKSRHRVHAVLNENKARKVAVERVNDLLARDALKYRRGVVHAVHRLVQETWDTLYGDEHEVPDLRRWRLGYNVSSEGTEMEGSRLKWEVEHWAYPIPKEGEAQKQDPDDHTADGADLVAADRYAIMSHLKPGREEKPEEKPDPNVDRGLEKIVERHEKQRRAEERAARRMLRGLSRGRK